MSVASLRAAMGTALRTVSGLHVSDYLADEILPPHAMFDYSIEPHQVFGATDAIYRFRIKVFVSRSSDTAGQKFLDLLRDPTTTTSLTYIVENDATLAAASDYVRVTNVSEVQISATAIEFLMVEWEVEVGV